MKINEALKLLGQGQVYYPKLAKKIGITKAIFLTYLGYWSDENDELYRTNEEVCNDTALSLRQLKCIQGVFVQKGWITKQVKGVARITYYKIHWEKINDDLNEQDTQSKSTKRTNAKVQNVLMQEDKMYQCKSTKCTNDTYNNKYNNKYNNIPKGFEPIIEKWLNYKHKRRETYKNDQQIQIMINRLIKMSNNLPNIANEIIEQSIANNYAGFFELKGSKYANRRNNKATVGVEPQASASYDDDDVL